jgi:peptidoglycan-associated lipoprotein
MMDAVDYPRKRLSVRPGESRANRPKRCMADVSLIGLFSVCAAVLVTGCARQSPPLTKIESPSSQAPAAAAAVVSPPPPAPTPPRPAPAARLTDEEIFARKTLDELNAERPLGDAFFDFDRYMIREDARRTLQQNAGWLRHWDSTRITVEGHGDARGTSEYNLALGERRANAAKQYLVGLGIAPGRILAVTKGEESPVCTESSESCWQQNRRAHSMITAK